MSSFNTLHTTGQCPASTRCIQLDSVQLQHVAYNWTVSSFNTLHTTGQCPASTRCIQLDSVQLQHVAYNWTALIFPFSYLISLSLSYSPCLSLSVSLSLSLCLSACLSLSHSLSVSLLCYVHLDFDFTPLLWTLFETIKVCVCLSRSLLPELTVDGLIRLLHHIEADLGTSAQDAEYYSSPMFDAEEKIDLIQSVPFRGLRVRV